MGRKLQIKRGVEADLPTLSSGELALTTDKKELYYGTGAENIPVAKKSHSHNMSEVANLELSLSNKADKTPPTEYNLPLASGWQKESWGDCKFSKTQDGIVLVNLAAENAADVASCAIAIMPAGYRPTYAIDVPAVLSNQASSSIYAGYVVVDASGTVAFGSASGSNAGRVRCSISFVAAH